MDQNPMKNQAIARRNAQAGSVLVIILIAVALFAALSWAMTQGSRQTATTATDQTAKLAAGEIITYLNQVKAAFDTLLINGCDPLKVDFTSNVYKRADGNNIETAPPGASASCGLFNAQGGNIKAVTFDKFLQPVGTPAAAYYSPAGTDWRSTHFGARYYEATGLGTNANDLVFWAQNFKEEICIAGLNILAGSNNFTSVPVDEGTSAAGNSYTPGTAGSLNAFSMFTNTKIVIRKDFVGQKFCLMGIVLKVN